MLVRKEVAAEAARFLETHGRQPGLEVVLVGEDAASQVYVRNKERAAGKSGIRGAVHRLSASASQEELLALLNANECVDGILVQLPVPEGLDELATTDAIDPRKDVDGLHPINAGRLAVGRPGLQPCTPRGCMRLLQETGVELEGKRAIVIGCSNVVGHRQESSTTSWRWPSVFLTTHAHASSHHSDCALVHQPTCAVTPGGEPCFWTAPMEFLLGSVGARSGRHPSRRLGRCVCARTRDRQ